MTTIKNKFFWASYGKLAAAAILGFGATSAVLGVPGETAAELTAGAVLSFPAAYMFSNRSTSTKPPEYSGP